MQFIHEINQITAQIPGYVPNEFDRKLETATKVYLYGAGFLGCKYADILQQNGYCVLGLFETTCSEDSKEWRNQYQVMAPRYQEYPVIISSFRYAPEMKQSLIKLGYTEQNIILPYAVFEKFYLCKFFTAYHAFEDELSKRIIIDKIKYLVLEKNMNPVSAYFDSEMFEVGMEEVFVDGGAFDGETTKEFAAIVNGKYKKIYCFEPTKSNYELSIKNLEDLENVEIINKGLYSKEDTLKFKDFGTDQWNAVEDYFMGHEWKGPKVECKIVEIPVTSLDIFFADKPRSEYPTIVKLDIEGSEREALIGMKTVINTAHPRLIICAYHKIEDYYELSQIIKEICPAYQLKLRHYSMDNLESIIFGRYVE